MLETCASFAQCWQLQLLHVNKFQFLPCLWCWISTLELEFKRVLYELIMWSKFLALFFTMPSMNMMRYVCTVLYLLIYIFIYSQHCIQVDIFLHLVNKIWRIRALHKGMSVLISVCWDNVYAKHYIETTSRPKSLPATFWREVKQIYYDGDPKECYISWCLPWSHHY